ncbi:MAG TPA: carboxypeptidase-like regulatory domain-containing protein [Pirellulales bacterium]|nr:carboxypeptidase-like regulatory domain-containing protein [Pirellulales bacterium]
MDDTPVRAPAHHLQFSLRALFVLVGILACLSWPGAHLIRAWSHRPPPLAHVSGLVLLDGAPLESATVRFHPADGTRPATAGVTDARGRFELTTYFSADHVMRGAPIGTYVVTVHKSRAQPSALATPLTNWIGAIPKEQIPPELREYRPGKYESASTSGLSATVVAGADNSFTFSLSAE